MGYAPTRQQGIEDVQAVREYGWFLTLSKRVEENMARLRQRAQAALARLVPRG